MLRFAKIVSALAAIALLAYGLVLVPAEDDKRWLQCLWSAAFLGGFAVWPVRERTVPGVRGGTQSLAMVMLIGFTVLSVQLLRLQVVKADDIAGRRVTDEKGNVTTNVRPVRKGMKVKRGMITDNQGEVLAQNEVTSDGFSYRTYPVAAKYDIRSMSHLLGFVSTRFGITGLEGSYEDYLSGEKGNSWENLKNNIFNRGQQGNNLQLTINAQLQQRAFEALNGRVGSVVVLDAKTGAIRAMVSNPGFDPQQLTLNTSLDWNEENLRMSNYYAQLLEDSSNRPLINRSTQGLYTPGSVFKTVTAVAALNHPEIGKPDEIRCPEQLIPENGTTPVVNAVKNEESYIVQQHGQNYGLAAVYAFSCNTAFATYGLRLEDGGRGLLREQSERFHIFEPHNADVEADFTDLPTAISTLYAEEGFLDRPAAIADTAFGQGQIQVTPLQMAQVTQAIANRGKMMKPYLVQRITDPQGNVILETKPKVIGEPLSPQVAEQMFPVMEAVITRGWAGAKAAGVPGVRVGGKSGTAENPAGDPHAWFIEIGPLEDPKYAVAVMVENGGEGTSVGGGLAGQVMAAALEINP